MPTGCVTVHDEERADDRAGASVFQHIQLLKTDQAKGDSIMEQYPKQNNQFNKKFDTFNRS